MNRSTIRSTAKTRFGDPNNAVFADADWNDYIQAGYDFVIGSTPWWPFLEAKTSPLLVSSNGGTTNTAVLPTDVWKVIVAYNSTDQYPMDELSGERTPYDVYPYLSSYPGTPERYRIFGNKIEVYPYPQVDTNLIVEYRVRPADLGDGDSPVFPGQYHRLLVHYALEQAFTDDANPQMAGAHQTRWAAILKQMQTDLLGARGDSYPQIADTWN